MSTVCMRHSSSVNADSVKSEWLSTCLLHGATRVQDGVDKTIGKQKITMGQRWVK
jgi:hypothetical protein